MEEFGKRQWHLNKIPIEKHFCNKSELTKEKRQEILRHLRYWGYVFLENIQIDKYNEILYVSRHCEHIIIYINEICLQLNDKETILNQVAVSLTKAKWYNSKQIDKVIEYEISKYCKKGENNE